MSPLLRLPARPDLRFLPTTGSTNQDACSWARAGGPDGACVVADAQTAGRGRQGRPWCSPPGVNLYCSLIMRLPLPSLRLAPLVGGLATGQAAEVSLPAGLRSSLKWPNDVLVEGHKVAGVLAVLVPGSEPPAAVVGIGLNVNMRPGEFPPDLRRPAASLAMLAGVELDRSTCLEALLAALDGWRARLRADPASVVPAFSARCETLGQRVRIELPGASPLEGLALAIEPDGALRVQDDRGQIHRLEAGDLEPVLNRGRS